MDNKKRSVIWLVRTAGLIALLVATQWATAGFGQFITGTCVNAVLAVAVQVCGLWSGIVVALLSPFWAFLLGIGPKLITVVPVIALGNTVLVLLLYMIIGTGKATILKQALGIVAAAAAKFAVLYLLVVQMLVPLMGDALPVKQVETFRIMFSWPQLVTALAGSILAALVVPVIRKAVTKKV